MQDRLDRINGRFQHPDVGNGGHQESHCRWDAHQMAICARWAAIGRIRAGRFAPPGAGTVAVSNKTRDRSIVSASPKRRRYTW